MKLRAGPSGLHLFERQTGWNVLVDEVRIPSPQWARAPQQVSVALTNACDLACPYCYAPKASGSLDADRLAGWLRELDGNGCFGVGFGGGEPTLHRRFIEICQKTAVATNLAVTFTTHAHRITLAHRESLKGSVHFVRVSVDGVGTTYEELRGRPFAAIRSQLEIVREIAPFGINFVVNSRTFADLDGAIDLARECGAGEVLLLPEEPVDGMGGVEPETLCALKKWVAQYRGAVPLAISESHSKAVCSDALCAEAGLRAYAHVDANGFLKRSSYDKGGVLIGPGGVMEALQKLEAGPVEGQKR